MILLEKCETPLKSWLKEQERVSGDVQDAMIDFTIDIARALKHLHDLEVCSTFMVACTCLLFVFQWKYTVVELDMSTKPTYSIYNTNTCILICTRQC